ncbi:MAG: hypothetical protein H6Q74_3122, partial [Firmicutes bacterium]|nr:hypothetical protein [Bacillota bacterium]MBP2652297.1 hypothetical protein [Bacillota bacterium]
MAKVISADQAMSHINDAAVVMIGGFLA